MDSILRICTAGMLGLAALAGGCGGAAPQNGKELSDFSASCIAVLPAVRIDDPDRQLTAEEEKAMDQGVAALNRGLHERFAGRSDVKIISEEQSYGPRQSLERAKAAAAHSGCNAALETTLHRYRERIGGEYTAKEPAAAAFSYRLLAFPEGSRLCMGRFDEEQQSLMENLLNFGASAENSFVWITADRLLAQGMRDRMDECAWLASGK